MEGVLVECGGEWCEKYKPFMIKKDSIKVNTKYWVCDVDMSVRCTQDNVFQCDFSYKGKLIRNGSYIPFKSKIQAMNFSKELYIKETEYYK